ncbi:MAG TPA: hypothetical protein VH206_14380 [Xanthobacteraceae bacterium]|jgi:hypothetical protein|nr:hypothetical protein [Xanthobacteraceae bacterium]
MQHTLVLLSMSGIGASLLYFTIFGIRKGIKALGEKPVALASGLFGAAIFLLGSLDILANLLSSGATPPSPPPIIRSDSNPVAVPASLPPERAASRLFAGPNQYPPADFAAYGIVAFPARPTTADRDRYIMICEAYVAVLPHASELDLPDSQQMVTVWPVSSDPAATRLNRQPRDEICDQAVDGYGLVVADEALRDATNEKAELNGRGPFLLAWSPSTQKGKPDSLVLVANLSNVTTSDEAKYRFIRWKKNILENADIWNPGWNVERVRTEMREWADQFGPQILSLFGGKP